jgi:hypothetical protein
MCEDDLILLLSGQSDYFSSVQSLISPIRSLRTVVSSSLARHGCAHPKIQGRPLVAFHLPECTLGVRLDMSRIHPERPDSVPPDRLPADVLLRQEPDEEEDDEEDEGNGKEDDDDGDTADDGYSE